MDINELKRNCATWISELQQINAAIGDKLPDETQQRSYDELKAKIATATQTIKRVEEVEGLSADLRSQPGEQAQVPAYIERQTADTAEAIFTRYLRTKDNGALTEYRSGISAEYRASNATDMNITTAGDGGDLVPVGHYNQIIQRLRPLSLPERLGVRRIPGIGTVVNVPVDAEADSGEFVSTAESNQFDLDTPAVSKIAMTLVKYTKRLPITYELMQDEDSNLMAFLSDYVAQGMAATLNKLMITEALADGTAALTLDSATAIGAGEIPELLYKLSAQYASGANIAWMMRRATEGTVRGLASTNQWLFAPTPGGTGNGTAWGTLWGVPQYSDENMGALAASGKSLLIGNWSYMGMRLSPAITFLYDPYSRGGYGENVLHYYFRCDFEVLQAAAFQYATHPTASTA